MFLQSGHFAFIMGSIPRYGVVLYVVTSGSHGEGLGSDESDTVNLTWLVVDFLNTKVSALINS